MNAKHFYHNGEDVSRAHDSLDAMAYAFAQMSRQAEAAQRAMEEMAAAWNTTLRRVGTPMAMVHDSFLIEAYGQRPFYTDEVWGWDWGNLALRLYWYDNLGWPKITKDSWCWHFTAGPIYLSGHRGSILP